MKNILSWQTWKKHNKPEIYSCCDGIKCWARETIHPTLSKNGFSPISYDFDYGFSTKTKQWAIEEAEFYLEQNNLKMEECEFVYFYSRGTNDYMDCRALFVRHKEA